MAIRLVLVDDHPIVLQGLEQLFERHEDFEVVSCCPDGATALVAVEKYQPDVLVMDLRMPGLSGLDVLRSLSASQSRCRSVLLTAIVRDSEVMEAIRLGVRGIVLKESSPDVLIDCVRRVHRGEQWIERETVTRALQNVAGSRVGGTRSGRDAHAPGDRDRADGGAGACATRSSPIASPSRKAPSRCTSTTSTRSSASTAGWNWSSAPSRRG